MSTPRPRSTAACSAGRSTTSRRPASRRFVMAQRRRADGGRDRRAVRGRRGPGVEHVRQRRRTRTRSSPRSRPRAARSWRRRSTSGRRAGWPSSPTPRARSSASGRPGSTHGVQLVNAPGLVELERSRDARHRRREGVLRRGLRLGVQRGRLRPGPERDDPRRRATASTSSADAGHAREPQVDGRARGLLGRDRLDAAARPRERRRPLGRHVLGRRRRRDRRAARASSAAPCWSSPSTSRTSGWPCCATRTARRSRSGSSSRRSTERASLARRRRRASAESGVTGPNRRRSPKGSTTGRRGARCRRRADRA